MILITCQLGKAGKQWILIGNPAHTLITFQICGLHGEIKPSLYSMNEMLIPTDSFFPIYESFRIENVISNKSGFNQNFAFYIISIPLITSSSLIKISPLYINVKF